MPVDGCRPARTVRFPSTTITSNPASHLSVADEKRVHQRKPSKRLQPPADFAISVAKKPHNSLTKQEPSRARGRLSSGRVSAHPHRRNPSTETFMTRHRS